jgi:hypothetical protein
MPLQGALHSFNIYVLTAESKPGRALARQKGGHCAPRYLENFLYFIRCGMIESMPSRRILSFS